MIVIRKDRPDRHTQKTVFFNQRKISLIYGERKNFFELKQVLLIQTVSLNQRNISLMYGERKNFFDSTKLSSI